MKPEHWLILSSLALLALGSLVLIPSRFSPFDPIGLRSGSSHGTGPHGAEAAFRILDRLGCSVSRHERQWTFLPDESRLLIVASLPDIPGLAPSEKELDLLKTWVEEGGSLLWFPRPTLTPEPAPTDPSDTPLPRPRPLPFPEEDPVSDMFEWRLERDPAPTLLPNIPGTLAPFSVPERYILSAGDSGMHLVPDGDLPFDVIAGSSEHPRIIAQRTGEGWFVAFADTDLLTNRGIGEADNAVFLAKLVHLLHEEGPVVFDEYHHGFQRDQTFWSLLLETSSGPALVVMIFLLLLAAHSLGRRIGPPLADLSHRRRRPAEFLEAFANFCLRRNASEVVQNILLRRFRNDLRATTGAETAAAAARRTGSPEEEIRALMNRMKTPPRNDADLLERTRELETLSRALRRSP